MRLPGRSGGPVAELERELEQRRQQIAADEAAIADHAAQAQAAEAAKAGAADDPAAFAEVRARIEQHASERERLELVLARRRGELAACEQRLADARVAVALQAYTGVCQAANRAVDAFTARPNGGTLKALEKARRHRGELRAALAELVDEWPEVAEEDEPDFGPDAKRVAEALAKGPEQPRAREAASVEQGRVARRRADEDLLRWFVQHGIRFGSLEENLQQLPERLRDEGRRRALAAYEQGRRAREARAGDDREPGELRPGEAYPTIEVWSG